MLDGIKLLMTKFVVGLELKPPSISTLPISLNLVGNSSVMMTYFGFKYLKKNISMSTGLAKELLQSGKLSTSVLPSSTKVLDGLSKKVIVLTF